MGQVPGQHPRAVTAAMSNSAGLHAVREMLIGKLDNISFIGDQVGPDEVVAFARRIWATLAHVSADCMSTYKTLLQSGAPQPKENILSLSRSGIPRAPAPHYRTISEN